MHHRITNERSQPIIICVHSRNRHATANTGTYDRNAIAMIGIEVRIRCVHPLLLFWPQLFLWQLPKQRRRRQTKNETLLDQVQGTNFVAVLCSIPFPFITTNHTESSKKKQRQSTRTRERERERERSIKRRMSAARTSGSKIVACAVGMTLGAVGIGSVWLPFFADRDQIRGLHEEQSPPTSSMLAQEIAKLQKEGLLKADNDHTGTTVPGSSSPPPPPKAPGSMWKNMK